MTPSTAFQWRRFACRFEAFQRTTPKPLADQVQGWLRTLPASQQGAARCALKWHLGAQAVAWGTIEVAAYHRDESRLRASVLDAAARDRVRGAARGAKERALVECLFTARRFEVARLCWRDLDLGHGTVTIRQGKGGRSAETLLTPGAVAALTAWFLEAGQPPDEAPVFAIPPGVGHPKRTGQPYTAGGIGKIVQKLLTRAGCWATGAGGSHRFRRTFASEFLRANEKDLVGLQALMRHKHIATTQQYIFFNPTDLSDRMGRVQL